MGRVGSSNTLSQRPMIRHQRSKSVAQRSEHFQIEARRPKLLPLLQLLSSPHQNLLRPLQQGLKIAQLPLLAIPKIVLLSSPTMIPYRHCPNPRIRRENALIGRRDSSALFLSKQSKIGWIRLTPLTMTTVSPLRNIKYLLPGLEYLLALSTNTCAQIWRRGGRFTRTLTGGRSDC